MCLQSKWIFPRRATKDIVCYKVLIKYANENLKTPYQKFPIGNIKELPITVEGGKGKSIKQYIKNIIFIYKHHKILSIISQLKCKEEGYIHAFNNLYSAKLFVQYYKYSFYGELIIVKCIIPKGILYHLDVYEICARKMIISEIVEI